MLVKGSLGITVILKWFPTWGIYEESYTAWSLELRSLFRGGVSNTGIGHLNSCEKWHEVFTKQTYLHRYIMNIINNSKGPSKEAINLTKRNKGLPKGSNPQGNRVSNCTRFLLISKKYNLGNSKWRESGTVLMNFQERSYSSVENNKVLSRLNKIAELSKQHPNSVIDRNLYNFLFEKELYIIAYDKLKSNPGNMTPGLDETTLDGFSENTIKSITNSFLNNCFEFKPYRRIYIPKFNGETRPLTIASPIDKIVLEVIRMILEIIFEPTFTTDSHGFRPNRSCHTALKYVETHFKSARIIIEGDISNFFDTIDHKILLSLLLKRIKDHKFINIIRKALKAGYGESHKVIKANLIGTTQGTPLSPLLSNIYLNVFDKHMIQLKEQFDKGTKPSIDKKDRSISGLLLRNQNKAIKIGYTKKTLLQTKRYIDCDSTYKRLIYTRYADDFIIGVRGSLKEANEIKYKCKEFLEKTLKLTLNDKKTIVTSIQKNKVIFLGAHISLKQFNVLSRIVKNGKKSYKQRKGIYIRLEAPIKRIWQKLSEAGYHKGFKPISKNILIPNTKEQIIDHYNSVLRGYLNYYSFAANYGNLVSIIRYILWKSCALTLAIKYKLKRIAKVIKKFGKNLKGNSNIGFMDVNYKIKKGNNRFNINAQPI